RSDGSPGGGLNGVDRGRQRIDVYGNRKRGSDSVIQCQNCRTRRESRWELEIELRWRSVEDRGRLTTDGNYRRRGPGRKVGPIQTYDGAGICTVKARQGVLQNRKRSG